MKFYTVDVKYVKHLFQVDSEVFYEVNYGNKPYMGIICENQNYNYFIPLTSAKPKHIRWKNVSRTNYVIYEHINRITNIPTNWVYKIDTQNKQTKHILAVLEIKKMIPVPLGLFSKVDFNQIADINYRSLLLKEYHFLKRYESDIVTKADLIYQKQISTGIVEPFCCNFKLLEKECDNYTP